MSNFKYTVEVSRNKCCRRSGNVLEVDLHDGSTRDGFTTRFRLADGFEIKKDLPLARRYVRGRSRLAILFATVAVIRKVRGVADAVIDAQALQQSDKVLLAADRVILWPPL